jgi:hypothetical protein
MWLILQGFLEKLGYCIVRCLIVLYTCLIVSCVLVLGSVIPFYDCLFFVPFASTLCVLYFRLSCTLFLLMYICSFLFVYSLRTAATG